MDVQMIRELMQEFDASGIYRMKIESEELELELEKAPVAQSVAVQPPIVPVAQPVVAAPQEVVAEAAEVKGTEVKSPIVGVFYPASSPEAEPYVQVGQSIKKGQTLCIIEAMKVMNEVPAPCDGVVAAINVQREELVEYGQVIMVIQ